MVGGAFGAALEAVLEVAPGVTTGVAVDPGEDVLAALLAFGSPADGVVGLVGVGGAGGVALTPLANAVRTNMVWRMTSGKVRLTRKLLDNRSGSRLTPAHSVTASDRRSRGALVQRCSPAGVTP